MTDFITYIKKFETKSIVEYFALLSIRMLKNQFSGAENEPTNCSMSFPLEVLQFGFIPKRVSVLISAWEILDIDYESIIHANDYRSEQISDKNVAVLINLYRGFENDKTDDEYLKRTNLSGIYKYLMGMTYEQFRYQTLNWSIQNFNRNYHIFVGSPKIRRDRIIDINDLIMKRFGMNVDEFLMSQIMIAWLCSQSVKPLSISGTLYNKRANGILNRKNLENIIQYYSVSYNDVRKSGIGKQIFYSKPFVKTQSKREYILVNIYSLLMVYADSLYWMLRDYYFDIESQEFVHAFGKMFEDYFEELVEEHLPKELWRRIPEGKRKSADYCIETEKAVLLFEIKSGLMGIKAKQQVPDISQIEEFYNRNIRKAYKQLKCSEEDYVGNKPVLKIFLIYEFSNNTHIMMSSLPEIFERDKSCFIMTIQELEMLLVTYKNDIDRFNKIIGLLLDSINDSNDSTSILHLLEDNNAVNNYYFTNEKDYLEKILKKLELEL